MASVEIKDLSDENEEHEDLKCWDCNVNFTSSYFLNKHLLFHIKQPKVVLTRIHLPIRITIKSNKTKDNFEIVKSPSYNTEDITAALAENDGNGEGEERLQTEEGQVDPECLEGEYATNISFSPNFVNSNGMGSPAVTSDNSNCSGNYNSDANNIDPIIEDLTPQEFGNIPGAEPTPPPEPSPEYPKIRIKTTGLLKESLTITEITDDNPDGDVRPEIIELGAANDNHSTINYNNDSNIWTTPSLEDPLRLPEAGGDKDDGNLLSLFSNNERAKDLGFTSSESEFISLDRLDDRNSTALQLYNSHSVTSTPNQNPLDSLTGLPMQQLAQQVSRLQPGNGMHQQNVLINIQQFPQAPPQAPSHGYQPPPMYHHPPQPMYQPYQYQPPNHMYYPPGPPSYPPHMPPPPPQMGQPPPQQQQQQPLPPPQQQQQQQQSQQPQPMQQQNQYRAPMGPRQAPAPRQPAPGQRAPLAPRQPLGPRQPMQMRQRAPMIRPRGGGMAPTRGPRPRMMGPQSGTQQQMQNNQQRVVKRTPEQIQALQAKRKKVDVLVPDKNDDPDCQVICTQPKNTDGGLPQIQSVQGGTPDPADGNVMHLSDSITLSVRNPPPKPQSPKKSDAKAVANILATRGITVTATAKPKEKVESPKKSSPPPPPVAINLNSAVSILPAAKSSPKPASQSSSTDTRLQTVDLTDDSVGETSTSLPPPKPVSSPTKQAQRGSLPWRCDLCPAQYPNAMGLNKHKQTYHKTGGPCEVGVPLVNLKVPGIIQKLSSLGIFNYIPLPGAGSEGNFGIPIVNARNPGNAAAIGATSVLTLGHIRHIPKPQMNNNTNNNSGK